MVNLAALSFGNITGYYLCERSVLCVLRFYLHGCFVGQNQRLVLHEVARSPSRDELALGEVTRLLTAAGSHIDAISNDHGAVRRCCIGR